MRVPIHELRNGLSKFLRRVQDGEMLTITSHQKVVAYVVPGEQTADTLQPGISPGLPGVQWTGKAQNFAGPRVTNHSGKLLSVLVLEDRGER
jgi:prevent-host-death family protein